jgi:hypothetical protein
MAKAKSLKDLIEPLTATSWKVSRSTKKMKEKVHRNGQETAHETNVKSSHVPLRLQDKPFQKTVHDLDVALKSQAQLLETKVRDQSVALKLQDRTSETSAQDGHAAVRSQEQFDEAKRKENTARIAPQKGTTQTISQEKPVKTTPQEHPNQTTDCNQITQGSQEEQQIETSSTGQFVHAVPKKKLVQTKIQKRSPQKAVEKQSARAPSQEHPVQKHPKVPSGQIGPAKDPVQVLSNRQPTQASIEKHLVQASTQGQPAQLPSTEQTVRSLPRGQPVQIVPEVPPAQVVLEKQPVHVNPKIRPAPAISEDLPAQTIRGQQHIQVSQRLQSTTKERLEHVIPEVESAQTETRDRTWTRILRRSSLQIVPQNQSIRETAAKQPLQTPKNYANWTKKLLRDLAFHKPPQDQPTKYNVRKQATSKVAPVNTLNTTPRKQPIEPDAKDRHSRPGSREHPKHITGRQLAKRLHRSHILNNTTIKSPLVEFLRQKTAFFGTRVFHFLTWLRGEPREHFGPTCRIPDLFVRRDQTFLTLSAEKLRWLLPPPVMFHDIFAVAKKVHQIEEIIGWDFKNKMLIVEALKMSGSSYPLYFNGTVHPVENNNRLALLGDRALSLSLTETWYHGGKSTKDYTSMNLETITRASLAARGRKIGLDASILIPDSLPSANLNQIAESFEAILGAVYVDAGNQLGPVTKVIATLEVDNHFRKGVVSVSDIAVDSKPSSPSVSTRKAPSP